MPHILRAAGGSLCILALGACASDGVDTPHDRLGALPFPGAFTLYAASDASALGKHYYGGWWNRPFEEEGARGIVYTCRGGFLDLDHVREGADWVRYFHGKCRPLLAAGGGTIRLTFDAATIELELSLPAGLATLTDSERAPVVEELAVRASQRAAYYVMVWHEVAQWFGRRSIFFVSETGSAFTWEDLYSDLLGVHAGGLAARQGEAHYDESAAAALRHAVAELGPVPANDVNRAAFEVEGRWWRTGLAVRRHLDAGLASGGVEPWLVPGIEFCPDAEPARLEVPSLEDVRGIDARSSFELRLTPEKWLAARISSGDPDPPTHYIADRDLPWMIERIRTDMKAQFGPDCDRP